MRVKGLIELIAELHYVSDCPDTVTKKNDYKCDSINNTYGEDDEDVTCKRCWLRELNRLKSTTKETT